MGSCCSELPGPCGAGTDPQAAPRQLVGSAAEIESPDGRSFVLRGQVDDDATLVLDGDAPLIWSWLWVVAMTGVASYTVARRAPDVERIAGRADGERHAAAGALRVREVDGRRRRPFRAMLAQVLDDADHFAVTPSATAP